ncbi:MAG: alpha/beta hydrolase [Actinomycetota bacterium]|nr:alpha/beta hydrolase [Actinomycetota bacterium]
METVPTEVGSLRVEVDGSGPPAVLWHSLFLDSTSWTRLRGNLAEVRTLILIDGPGHGANPTPPGPFSMADCAAAALTILDAIGIARPVDWLGNAWGGHVGVFFAAGNPTACRSLITIATPLRVLSPPERRKVRLLYELHRLVGPRPVAALVTDALLGKAFRRSNPDAGAVVSASFVRANRAGMRDAIRSISLNRADSTDRLPAVVAPTLMLTGADDAMCTPADTAAWAARIPAGQSLVVPGAGHVTPLFQPQTADVIRNFWTRSG